MAAGKGAEAGAAAAAASAAPKDRQMSHTLETCAHAP